MSNIVSIEGIRWLYFKDEKWEVERLAVSSASVPWIKKQMNENIFVDLGDRMIPRRLIQKFCKWKNESEIDSYILGLERSVRNKLEERMKKNEKLTWAKRDLKRVKDYVEYLKK